MSSHRYPPAALIGDYLRAGFGLLLVGLPLIALPLNPWVALALALLTALFLVFGTRTALRHASRIEVSERGLVLSGPISARLDWASLDAVRLDYYATRRDGRNGWLQLALKGNGRTVRLDSRIGGFEAIAARAATAAQARHLSLSPTTAANLAALGITLAEAMQ